MASISLPRVLTQRRGGPIEVERENFWKAQAASINKAINNQETPVKEKHVRSAIIGTYHERGATTFWTVVQLLPLQGNPIVCWKFCHTLHKLLREGHPNVIPESRIHKSRLIELGKYWNHLKDSIGKLIFCYCNVLANRLDFHSKNPKFPGNLQLNDEQLESIGEMDINNFFQISVEMFDYMDEILSLQNAVFNSLDSARSNSMTNAGQCRLAPLIPCIQDSSLIYDYLVKLLFKLHSSLPPDILIGHRDRFYKQFKILQEFYKKACVLQYFKHLIQIPPLPEEPPNFLVKSDLSSHISPVVILPPQEDLGDNDSVDLQLVDTSSIPNLLDIETTNGSVSPDLLSEKDQIIEHLRREIEELKYEIQRLKVDHQKIVGEFQQQAVALEALVKDLQQQLLTKQQEVDALQTNMSALAANSTAAEKLVDAEQKCKANEVKFNKMKEVYNKLREEHIVLLRAKADVEKQFNSAKQVSQDTEKTKSDLEEQLSELSNDKTALQLTVSELKDQVERLESEIHTGRKEADNERRKIATDASDRQFALLVGCLEEAENIIQKALNELDNPIAATMSCPPEYLLSISSPLLELLDTLWQQNGTYNQTNEDLQNLLKSVAGFSHFLGHLIIQGKAAANVLPDIDDGDKLTKACRKSGEDALLLLTSLKTKGSDSQGTDGMERVRSDIAAVRGIAEALVASQAAKAGDQVEDLVERELADMDRAIEEAANRIAQILAKSREAKTGVKLEVSEKILDACTALMRSIKVLVQRSKALQQEILDQGRGSATVKEFYKRNHQWTEGLLSAAKAVGIGAKFLVDAADKVVNGQAKFETLMAASQEIAASTAQLVVASKVKAAPGSENLQHLSKASTEVRGCTGTVVATVKDCAQMMEDSDVMDFESLTLHQAKRLEMESQVRVLELENSLEKERIKLSALRKKHYAMADPGEGWEPEDQAK